MELALSDPLYSVTREEAVRRAGTHVAERYGRAADEKKGWKK